LLFHSSTAPYWPSVIGLIVRNNIWPLFSLILVEELLLVYKCN
jgi:hypothetical protein